jgi:hydrogenase/urease accessory protein HupE
MLNSIGQLASDQDLSLQWVLGFMFLTIVLAAIVLRLGVQLAVLTALPLRLMVTGRRLRSGKYRQTGDRVRVD